MHTRKLTMIKLTKNAVFFLLGVVLKILAVTYRVRYFDPIHPADAAASHPSRAYVLAMWHENMLSVAFGHAWQNFTVMASHSKDGAVAAHLARKIGVRAVRGSSSNGGRLALDEMVEKARCGNKLALTVDGPKGPRHCVKPGIIELARRSGIAIVPVCAVAEKAFVLHRSWDQTKIPKPFTRIAVRYDYPITVCPDRSFEYHRVAVEESLNRIESQATLDLATWNRGRPRFLAYVSGPPRSSRDFEHRPC